MAKILVIGRNGQVATALQHASLPVGWSLTALGREHVDLLQPKTIPATIAAQRPDALINAAAYTAVDQAESDEVTPQQVNGCAPGLLASMARELDIPFFHISTDYVFSGSFGHAWEEGDPTQPLNVYGRSKLAGEQAILEVGGCNVIVRTSWVFSSWGNNFVRTILRLAAKQSEIPVVADQFGGPTAADDVAAMLIRVAISLINGAANGRWGVYHFSGTPTVSWADFAEAIVKGANWLPWRPVIRRVGTVDFPTVARRPRNSVLSCAKIQTDFGIAQPDWRIALARTIAELRPVFTKRGET
jgi:dTDP-4-dehydrorhamnose reductase